jgi:hypothetical protein
MSPLWAAQRRGQAPTLHLINGNGAHRSKAYSLVDFHRSLRTLRCAVEPKTNRCDRGENTNSQFANKNHGTSENIFTINILTGLLVRLLPRIT